MYDTFNEIIGTQLLLYDDTFEISNQTQSFSQTNVASSSYNRLFKKDEASPSALLVEAKLSPSILLDEYFTEHEKYKLLTSQLFTILNMVPNDLSFFINLDLETCYFDLFEPYQILKGHNMSDFLLSEPKLIKNHLNNLDLESECHESLILNFINSNSLDSAKFNQYVRKRNQLGRDCFFSNSIFRSIAFNQIETTKLMIGHFVRKKKTFIEHQILMQLLPYIMGMEDPLPQYSEFFQDYLGEPD